MYRGGATGASLYLVKSGLGLAPGRPSACSDAEDSKDGMCLRAAVFSLSILQTAGHSEQEVMAVGSAATRSPVTSLSLLLSLLDSAE